MIWSIRSLRLKECAVFVLPILSCLISVAWLHEPGLAHPDASLVHHVGEAQGGTEDAPAPGSPEAEGRALLRKLQEQVKELPRDSPLLDRYMDTRNRAERRLEEMQAAHDEKLRHLRRANVFLAAGDYRRAVDACLLQVWERPSVESYVYMTYVYHAIDGYLEHLAKSDRWVDVQHLYLNLAARGAEDLIDPPSVLTRMAKEIIQGAVREQSDVTAAMATRLDKEATERLWKQQSAWREARPDGWWFGVPEEWKW